MFDQVKPHLPLIALAVVSALVILYLYRELQRAKKALVTEKAEECTSALCADKGQPAAKRVRFEGDAASAGGASGPPVARSSGTGQGRAGQGKDGSEKPGDKPGDKASSDKGGKPHDLRRGST